MRFLSHSFVSLHVILGLATAVFGQSALSSVTSPAHQTAMAQTGNTAQQFGSISGYIFRSDTKAPLAGALVSIEKADVYPSDEQIRRTGPDGSYEFRNMDPGAYVLSVSRAGFTPRTYGQQKPQLGTFGAAWIHITAGQALTGIDMGLDFGCPANLCPSRASRNLAAVPEKDRWTISGTLVDENGEPLDGDVRAVPKGPITEEAETDAQGHFEITGSGTKAIRLEAIAVGAEGTAYTAMFYPDALSLDAARVFDVSAGANIRDLHIVFKTVPTFSMNGKLLRKDTAAIRERYAIQVRNVDTGDAASVMSPESPTIVRLDNTFTIRGLQPGNYSLVVLGATRAITDGRVYYGTQIFPRLGETEARVTNADVNVQIPIGGPVEIGGRVTIDGEPGAYVMGPTIGLGLNRFANLAGVRGGQVVNGGDFKITGVVPGQYTLALYDAFVIPRRALFPPTSEPVYMKQVACGGVDYTDKPFTIEPGVPLGECNVVLAKNPGALIGVVYEGDKAAIDAAVMVIPQAPELRADPTRTLTKAVDANGRYEIREIPPGEYLLFAIPRDRADPYRASDLAGQNAADAVRITIRQNEIVTADLKEFQPK